MNSKNKDEYSDACEHQIAINIEIMINFIKSYGFQKKIIDFKETCNIKDIEEQMLNFLNLNSKGFNHFEVYGTLRKSQHSKVYVCCYEPYGDELICIECRNNALYFYDNMKELQYLGMSDIDYI